MAVAPEVGLVGVKALVRDLKKVESDTSGPVLVAMREAAREAAQPVAIRARGTLPDVSGDLVATVRVNATRTGASVRMGSARVPYAGWVEFGGRRHHPHESSRPYVKTGRYLFPVAADLATTVARHYDVALTAAFDRVRWTNTSPDGKAVHD
jgi:hypothetical protein